jgi:hypothetical protein
VSRDELGRAVKERACGHDANAGNLGWLDQIGGNLGDWAGLVPQEFAEARTLLGTKEEVEVGMMKVAAEDEDAFTRFCKADGKVRDGGRLALADAR